MSMDAARWSRRGALAGGAALAVGGLVGCVGGRSGRTTASVDPRALPLGSVRVRLPPHEGAAPLEVVVDGELRRLSRGPSGVVLDGRVAPRQRLEPMRELRLRGELHRGTLEVVPTAGGLGTYLELDLETYVAGVVAAELSLWSARPAELEAQAIAARSYATATLAQRRALGSRAALESGTQDQAYRGIYEPADSAGARAAGARLHAAVAATRGMVLEIGGSPLAARYSAACGGRTSDLAAVFPAASDRRAGRSRQGRPRRGHWSGRRRPLSSAQPGGCRRSPAPSRGSRRPRRAGARRRPSRRRCPLARRCPDRPGPGSRTRERPSTRERAAARGWRSRSCGPRWPAPRAPRVSPTTARARPQRRRPRRSRGRARGTSRGRPRWGPPPGFRGAAHLGA